MGEQTLNNNTAMRRIKYLTLMQIGDKLRNLKTGNRKKLGMSILLRTLLCLLITAVFWVVFNLISSTFQLQATKDMLITLMFFIQIVSVISCLSSMILLLFVSKENTMLLAFPCKYTEIFISKILVFSIEEVRKGLFFLLPLLIGFGVNADVSVAYWLQLPICWLVLCLLPVFISATLSIPAIYIKRFMQTHVWVYAVIVIALIIAIFFGIYSVLSQIEVPIKLVAVYGKFVAAVKQAFVTINSFALFYNFIGKTLFGEMVYLYLPLTLIVLSAFACLCFAVAMPFYFNAASSTAENSTKKKHAFKERAHGNLFFTFFRKEIKIFIRSFQDVNSAITVIFIFPVLIYIFNFVLSAINTNTLGNYIIIGFNIMIALSLLGTHNANIAMSLSSEGNEFAILKTAPSDTSVIGWAKIAVTAIVNLLSVSVMAIMLLITTRLSLTDVLLTVVTILIISVGQIAWSFEFDVRNPKIVEYATKGDGVTDNMNVAKGIAVGFIVSTLAGLLCLILLMDHYWSGWVRLLLIAAVFTLARFYLLRSNLKAYFSDIQG